jgi:hypothetical protein
MYISLKRMAKIHPELKVDVLNLHTAGNEMEKSGDVNFARILIPDKKYGARCAYHWKVWKKVYGVTVC